MKNINDYKLYYFIGIGGIGMSALARYFKLNNKLVVGYDKTKTELTQQLNNEGIECYYEIDVNHLKTRISEFSKEDILVVYTPAIPKEHGELLFFQNNNFLIKKRAEVLGDITKNYKTIAVAGTHGKTTTTSLITHILKHSDINLIAFVGGVMANYNTNFIYSVKHTNKETFVVVEADEYDKSFLKLNPYISVITSIDADHLDIYHTHHNLIQTYIEFANRTGRDGWIFVNKNVDNKFSDIKNKSTYSVNLSGDINAENILFNQGKMQFTLQIQNQIFSPVILGIPGIHNISNALAAIGVCDKLSISKNNIFEALSSFKGVKRRFEYHINTNDLVYIDDYAHHPQEIEAFISSVKSMYADKKIVGIFQPHLYSRTADFMNEFATVLSLLDEVILLDIYPARELPIPGVTSSALLDKIKNPNKKLVTKEGLINYLKNTHKEVVLTIGAGDIDMLIPDIKNTLLKK